MAGETQGQAILGLQNATKRFGAQTILEDASLTIHEGDRVGLIGRNGSGKSTLLRIFTGLDAPEEGFVTMRQGLRVAMLQQQCALSAASTVGEALRAASASVRALLDEHQRLSSDWAHTHGNPQLEERLSALQHELDLADAWNLESTIKRIATELALPPEDRRVSDLSGGELRRLDLAATLLQKPDVLLLDEPTNHIDIDSIQWLETFLAAYRGTCILVTHDRYFLERVVNRIVELTNARLYSYPGNYEVYLERKAAREIIEAQTEQNRRSFLRRELDWIIRGPKARATKQKARIKRFDDLDEQGPPPRDRAFDFAIPEPPRLGKIAIETKAISFAYGDAPLFQDFSFILQKGMRVGVLGPNGCGKTTLLRVLMGVEAPQSGLVIMGETAQFLYVDQSHEEINPAHTILQHVTGGAEYMEVNGQRLFIPSYLEKFLFDRATLRMPMENLSGGERNRIDLAKKLLRGGNILILDEPTNDLDLYTLRVLEEAVLAFQGCAILVSHDRFFLNRACTHILSFEQNGEVVLVAGNHDDYLRYARERTEAKALAQPKPVKERPPKPEAPKGKRLSWKEKQELATIEASIHEAEAEVQRLEDCIHEPKFYEQPYAKVQETLEALDAAKARVEERYTRWAELDAIEN